MVLISPRLKILVHIYRKGGCDRFKFIIANTGIISNNLVHYLINLLANGYLVKDEEGQYCITEKGKEVINELKKLLSCNE